MLYRYYLGGGRNQEGRGEERAGAVWESSQRSGEPGKALCYSMRITAASTRPRLERPGEVLDLAVLSDWLRLDSPYPPAAVTLFDMAGDRESSRGVGCTPVGSGHPRHRFLLSLYRYHQAGPETSQTQRSASTKYNAAWRCSLPSAGRMGWRRHIGSVTADPTRATVPGSLSPRGAGLTRSTGRGKKAYKKISGKGTRVVRVFRSVPRVPDERERRR